MPLLDVSDVLDDPMFRDDGLSVERTTRTVNDSGNGVDTTTVMPLSGVVTSAAGSLLMRVPEGERNGDWISIHTRFRLIDGEGEFTADIVTWMGKRWTVYSTNDYSRYGSGFVQALCQLIPMSG